MERKRIDKMTKSDMATELDTLRDDYDRLNLMHEIINFIGRMVMTVDLKKVRDYAEKVYKQSVDSWGFLYGKRDNICDMANNLAELWNTEELSFFNELMYDMLLDREPKATDGLYTMTDGMRRAFYERKKGEVA